MIFRFADCILDDAAYTLTRGGAAQDIEPQVFDFLLFLVQNPGALVTRDQMIKAVWNGRIVSESAISARISALRRAVGDDGKRQAVIRTLPRRGIQFVAPVNHDTPAQSPQAPAQPSIQPAAQTIRFATADDGVKIAYAASGTGAPLMRIAHHPAHLELEWAESTERTLFDNLGGYRRLFRVDQRGSGLSDIDVDNFSAARSAADIAAVADAAGLDRFALLGASSGAMVAVEFAARYPERLTHLVLLAGYVDGRTVRDATRDDAIATMAHAGWDTPNSAFVEGYLSVYFPTATKEQISTIARNVQNSCPMENEARAREFFNNHSIAPLLAQVRTPTLVLHSREDAVHPPSEAQKLARGIDGAQLVVLESRNHYPLPHEASWQIMTQTMRAFLQG